MAGPPTGDLCQRSGRAVATVFSAITSLVSLGIQLYFAYATRPEPEHPHPHREHLPPIARHLPHMAGAACGASASSCSQTHSPSRAGRRAGGAAAEAWRWPAQCSLAAGAAAAEPAPPSSPSARLCRSRRRASSRAPPMGPSPPAASSARCRPARRLRTALDHRVPHGAGAGSERGWGVGANCGVVAFEACDAAEPAATRSTVLDHQAARRVEPDLVARAVCVGIVEPRGA